MASSRSPDNHINLLRELDIPGRTKEPISSNPDVWGLNIAAVLDNFPRHGLQCLAGPWGVMGQGDRLAIFWGLGNQVLQKTVDVSEVNTELRMFVEARHILAGNVDVSYAVTRLGQTAEPSEVMKVLVKLTRPGGKDDNDTPGHSKLIMHIPREILEGGIDQDNVADGVDIGIDLYPDISPGDVIRLSWGGVFVLNPPLTQDQADGKTPIVIHVDEATIRDAGDSDSTGLAVVFELYDKVDNRSEDWSAAQRVVVSIDAARPMAPLLEETLNNVLDLDKLGDAEGTGQVIAMDKKFFAVGDTIFLKLKGTPVEGTPIDQELPGKVLESFPTILEISIDNALLRRLAKTQMVLSYRLQKADGSAEFHSKGQFISVIGELQRLKAPIAKDASQGALDPDLPHTRIEIPFDASFEAGQAIKLFWLGTLPDLTPSLPDLPLRPITHGDISAGEPLYITVDGIHIKPLEGGTLELYYQLLSDDSVLAKLDHYSALNAVRESEHAALLNVGEPRLELPAPTVAGVVDNVLDPDRNGTTLTATWLNTLANDTVTREWVGSKTGLSSDFVTLSSITAGKPVPFTINADLIKGNEGGTVRARYFVERAGERTRHSQPLDFSVGAALALDPPKIRQAEPDGKTLLPMNAVEALTAEVPPEGLLLTDLLSVTWAAAAGSHAEGSHTTEARPISETSLNIELPVTVLAFNLGKTVTVTFTVTRDGKSVTSLPLSLAVGTLPVDALNSPIITDADDNGVLDVTALGSNATIHARDWPLIAVGQQVWMSLAGKKANGDDHDHTVWAGGSSYVNSTWFAQKYWPRPVAKSYFNELADGSRLTLSFKAALDKSNVEAKALVFADQVYTIKAFKLPVATFWEATGAGNDLLNPDDVYPLGATVVIAQTALLKTDDFITVQVQGKTVTTYTHQVQPEEADKELKTIKVAYSVIADNVDLSISLSYSIARKAGGTDGPADPSVYDVRRVIGSGNLKVMGARNIRSAFRASSSSQVLSAFNKTTDQPVQAQWKYPGDSDWTTAATWRDSKPQEPLQVRTGDDQLTLNPANIIGNGEHMIDQAVFVALRDAGDVVAWGSDIYGATIPSPIITLNDIVEVSGTARAFAARRAGGGVVAWGLAGYGGDMAGVLPFDFVEVVGNGGAFAGRKTTGHVVAWGIPNSGGAVPAPISELNDVVRVVAAGSAFVAQRTTGHVLAWGYAGGGGTLPGDIARLTDLETIIGNWNAFAALRANGSLVAWGSKNSGGTLPDNIAAMTDIIELGCATNAAFTALRATGQVIAWGSAEDGGTIDPQIGALTDIVDVSATSRAFAARRGNGRVVAWGDSMWGGTVPGDIADLDDIVQVCGTFMAFAALRKNGTVVAWGNSYYGGSTSTVVDQLTNVQALYSNVCGFAALTSDGRVVTWGVPGGGGDSSAVQDRLRGQVSYLASPASRGRALNASRRAALNANPHLQDR